MIFCQKASVSLKSSVSSDEDKLEELIEKLGPDLLEEFFDVKVATVPNKNFDQLVAREGVYKELSEIIERLRNKPSVKVS